MKKVIPYLNKALTLLLVLLLISPVFSSIGVVASALDPESSETEEKEMDETVPAEEENIEESESNVDNSSDINEDSKKEETDIHTPDPSSEEADDDAVDEETSAEEEEESTTEQEEESDTSESEDTTSDEVDEYYSAEEIRDEAIKMMEDEQQSGTFSTFSRSSSKTASFISAVSSSAVAVSDEYDLYASVMIAQAALESAWGTSILAYAPNYNLFGMKGSYNGQSFSKYSKEYSEKDGWQFVQSDFKKYPSYKESFIDNGQRLRNGPSWDAGYYQGAWKENAATYKDAANSLTGRYATDPDYGAKLNSIIETYDLTRFDEDDQETDPDTGGDLEEALLVYDEVKSTKTISYASKITATTDGIYTHPKGTEGAEVVASTTEYEGKEARVSKEATTNEATWAYITVDGKELGWIDKRGLDIETVTSEKSINYAAKITRSTDGINTKPFGVEGYELVQLTTNLVGKEVRITKEAVTRRGTWAYISIDGKAAGWIDKRGLDIETVTSEKNINYAAKITRSTDGINTKPFGVEGYETVQLTTNLVGKEVRITKEAVTRRGTWAYISIDGKAAGWIDKRGLDIETVTSEKSINYAAKITRSTDGINTKPFGVEGYELVQLTTNLVGKEVRISKEAVTRRGTWAYISIDGKTVGWIDKRGLDIEKVTSTKTVQYNATVNRSTDGVNTKPFGVEGYVTSYMSSQIMRQQVTVTQEAVTRRGTWALISINGTVQGWIHKDALRIAKIVVIDPGHGGSEPGAVSGSLREKDLNLTVALKVRQRLQNAGYQVIMTRTTDVFVSLAERANTANKANADIFVSIHANSFNGSTSGIETFSYNSGGSPTNPVLSRNATRLLNSSNLTSSIQSSLIGATGAVNRGAKKANFHVLRETHVPATLVEIGFIDYTPDRLNLLSDAYQNKVADGIVQGINQYFSALK